MDGDGIMAMSAPNGPWEASTYEPLNHDLLSSSESEYSVPEVNHNQDVGDSSPLPLRTAPPARKPKPTCLWWLVCTFAFAVLALVLLLATTGIPAVNTQSSLYVLLFDRGTTHQTSYLPVGNLAFYWAMNLLGFLYVNVSNMNLSRKSVLFSNHESKYDFVMTAAMAPIFFFLGNNIALRATIDLSS